tara:strand:+ start:584 stop:1039 length:456 start_codon:yes stop_codon:yes gene_type:complete
MYKSILVGIDLSPKSCKSLEVAVEFAHLFNSKITLLNVHEEFLNKDEMVMSRVSVNKLQDTFKNISLKTKEKISDLVGSVKGDDIQTDIVLREGKAGQKIVELSNDLKPDLIVIGSNGKDSLADYICGTTASYVVDNSIVPVLVIPDVYDE